MWRCIAKAEMISRAIVLEIKQDDDQIVVNRNDDFALVCDFTAQVRRDSRLGQETCGWLKDQLAFELSLPEGLYVSHLMTLSPNGSRLNLATTVRSRRSTQQFTLNRVYMPYEPLEELYDCQYTLARKKSCTLGGLDQ